MKTVLLSVALAIVSATAWAGHSERRLIESKDTAIVYSNGDVAYWLIPDTTRVKMAWGGDCGDSIIPITILNNHILRARSGSVVNWDGTDERCTTLVDTIAIHKGDALWSGLDHKPPHEMHPCPKGSHKVYNSRVSFDSNPPQFRCECVKDLVADSLLPVDTVVWTFQRPQWVRMGDDTPPKPMVSLTIYYVDTVGWKQSTEKRGHTYSLPFTSREDIILACDTARNYDLIRVWLPILDTVIVGTVYLDSMPDKHKQLLIRKDR